MSKAEQLVRFLAGVDPAREISLWDYILVVRMDDQIMAGEDDLNDLYAAWPLGLDRTAWDAVYRQAINYASGKAEGLLEAPWYAQY